MATHRLPKKLSKKLPVAIRQAVHDEILCEKDDRYIIDMCVFHQPIYQLSKCEVCFAGGVIAQRLNIMPSLSCSPSDFDDKIMDMLFALDSIRSGDMDSYVFKVGIPWIREVSRSKSMTWLRRYDYEDDPRKFRKCLLRIADMLERRGY